MKKLVFAFIVLLSLVFLSGCGETNKKASIPEPTEFNEWVTWSIEKKGGAKVNRIEINDHDGTPDPNDKIALIYVDCSNSDTRELKKYSDQLFKEVYNKYPMYQEFVIFWTLNGDKKTTFKVYNERSETVYKP